MISEAISKLRPGASFSTDGDEIIWHDEVQTEPTREEIDAKILELEALKPHDTERQWRDEELQRADIEIFKTEDTVGVFDAETWRSYRLLLRAWPESPDFPNSAKRPIAPDAV